MKEIKNSNYYNIFILIFSFFVLLQISTGTIMFLKKIGIYPYQWMEYYYGSEEMLKYFPDKQDGFKEPLTFYGRLKVLYSHSIAYGILIFVISHLIRSLNLFFSLKKLEFSIYLLFIVAFFEIVLDVFLTLIESYRLFFLTVRVIFFFLFVFMISFHVFILLFFVYKHKKIKN